MCFKVQSLTKSLRLTFSQTSCSCKTLAVSFERQKTENKKTFFMKVNINIIYTSILLVLIVFVCIEYHNNNVLESRINSLNKNSIDFSSEKTFKEDFYITQQNRDTTLLLVFFPLFVGIVSFLTYVNITERHINSIEAIKTEAHKNKSEYDSYHKKFVLLETEFNFLFVFLCFGLTESLGFLYPKLPQATDR